jgi:hypothetical protein
MTHMRDLEFELNEGISRLVRGDELADVIEVSHPDVVPYISAFAALQRLAECEARPEFRKTLRNRLAGQAADGKAPESRIPRIVQQASAAGIAAFLLGSALNPALSAALAAQTSEALGQIYGDIVESVAEMGTDPAGETQQIIDEPTDADAPAPTPSDVQGQGRPWPLFDTRPGIAANPTPKESSDEPRHGAPGAKGSAPAGQPDAVDVPPTGGRDASETRSADLTHPAKAPVRGMTPSPGNPSRPASSKPDPTTSSPPPSQPGATTRPGWNSTAVPSAWPSPVTQPRGSGPVATPASPVAAPPAASHPDGDQPAAISGPEAESPPLVPATEPSPALGVTPTPQPETPAGPGKSADAPGHSNTPDADHPSQGRGDAQDNEDAGSKGPPSFAGPSGQGDPSSDPSPNATANGLSQTTGASPHPLATGNDAEPPTWAAGHPASPGPSQGSSGQSGGQQTGTGNASGSVSAQSNVHETNGAANSEPGGADHGNEPPANGSGPRASWSGRGQGTG